MFYLLYLYYADVAQDYPLLNLVQYQTVRVALAMATAMIVAVAMGSRFIAWMRTKQGKGQPIRADGPVSHLSKVGRLPLGRPDQSLYLDRVAGDGGLRGAGLHR